MTVHSFETSLRNGQKNDEAPFWGSIYRARFHNYRSHTTTRRICDEGKISLAMYQKFQMDGIDHIITLTNGIDLTADAKNRETRYGGDIGLEYISSDRGRFEWHDRPERHTHNCTPGWIEKDLTVDYLAYAFVPDRHAFVFDFRTLREAWLRYGDAWIAKYQVSPAQNRGYKTWSVYVPTDVLTAAYVEQFDVYWT